MYGNLAAQAAQRVLVLWDIDHTLIETAGVGARIHKRAFKAAFGRDSLHVVNMSGRTELDIMTELLSRNGMAADTDAISALSRVLIAGYEASKDELATRGSAMHGAVPTLTLLARDPRLHQSVLTGNLREVALIKLRTFGLDRYLDLSVGAYGDDAHDRVQLVRLAQERARARTGVAFGNSRTVVIGDTPNDVAAGRAAGVRVIAVATGKSSEDDLMQAGAEHVVPDLRNPEQIRDLLEGFIQARYGGGRGSA